MSRGWEPFCAENTTKKKSFRFERLDNKCSGAFPVRKGAISFFQKTSLFQNSYDNFSDARPIAFISRHMDSLPKAGMNHAMGF